MNHEPPLSARHPHWTAALLGLAAALALIEWVALLDGSPAVNPLAFWHAPLKPWLNALPFLLLATALAALTRRMVLSAWLAWLLAALLYTANALKVANLATPLMPADFRMLGQLEGGGHLLASYLPDSTGIWLAIAGAVLVSALLIRFEPPAIGRSPLPRLAVGSIAGALLATLLAAVPAWGQVYAPSLGLQPWSASNTARSTGLVSMLNLFHLRYSRSEPDPDPARARALLARIGTARADLQPPLHKSDRLQTIEPARAASTTRVLPDIVVVQSESFIDPGILKGYPDDAFIPQLTRLRRHGLHGRLHVPTFGGGTIRTEFEVLTGISLRYYPAVQFPYLEFHRNPMPGLPRVLGKHGYVSTAIHPNRPEFWNRSAAFEALGFDHFVSLADFPADVHYDGRYVADRDFTDEILRRLQDHGPPQFIYAISIEAHGPYDQQPGIDVAARDRIPVPAAIEGDPRRNLQTFIYQIRHADHELGRLADALAKRQRPTLLLFFGDHLPALVPAFQADGFDNGEGFFMQTVPWLLIEPDRPGPGKKLAHEAAWTLPGLLMARAGIRDSAWFNLVHAVGPQLADLTRAFDAPKPDPGKRAELDSDMASATWLHMRGKLSPLLPAESARPAAENPLP